MLFKKNKIFIFVLICIMLAAFFTLGASADDETPIVPIDPPDVVSISFKEMPYKTCYIVGEKLDMSGAVLELTYDTGAKGTTPVKTDWCTGFSSAKVGEKTVTIKYPDSDAKTTFKVEVVTEKSLKINPPKTLTYFVGDKEDRSGLTVSVVYSNGDSVLLESGYTVSGFSSSSAGEKTITVKYKDLSASYKVSVFNPALQKITISKKPAKLSYYLGEKLDTSGIKVTASYENGKTADVTSKITVTGDLSSAGTKKITVSYTERDVKKTATYDVTVTDVQIKNIVFESYPTKTVYTEDEVFDPAGISIKVTYNNGKVETVSENIMFSGFDTDTVGEKTMTLHYGAYQLNFTVTVVVSQSHVHKEGEFLKTKDPTCTEEGEESTACSVCFETVSIRKIPALGHGAESSPVKTKGQTCTEPGEMTTYCLVCGGVVEVSEIAPNGHTDGEPQLLPAPTCTESGISKTYCTVCNVETKHEDLAPLGHTDGEPQFLPAPTCTESGISKTFCTVCNAETKHEDLAPLGHAFSEWTLVLEPTGESEGAEERVCSVCSHKETNPIEKLVQIMADSGISATLNSSASYYPYNSSFKANMISESVTAEELAAYIPEGYVLIDVFEFIFTDKNGSEFYPSSDVTYSVEYALDTEKYSSFLICDTEMGRYTPFTDDSKFGFTVQRSGRFILVGEEIPETEAPESSDAEGDTSTGLPTSTNPNQKSPITVILIIVSIVLVVIIAGLIYFYVFKQYY